MTAALFIFMLLQPLFGALSDRIGRRNSMIAFSVLTTLCTVPLMHALQAVANPYQAFGLVLIALTIASFYTSISGLIKAEMFPTEVRALGVGFSYALANALFGGTAEYVALFLKSIDIESTFFWYVTAFCAMTLLVSLSLRDERREGYLQSEHMQ